MPDPLADRGVLRGTRVGEGEEVGRGPISQEHSTVAIHGAWASQRVDNRST